MSINEDFQKILDFTILAAKPSNFMLKIKFLNDNLIIQNSICNISKYRRIFVIGFGKSSADMAFQIEKLLKEKIHSGIVVTNEGNNKRLGKIKVLIGGHPILDESSIDAGNKIYQFLRMVTPEDLVINLVSGGGSALIERLPRSINLSDYQEFSKVFLNSGADIHEFNALRKHISEIKGGRLKQIAPDTDFINIILSDVIDDRLDVIASGPTMPDETTFEDCLKIIKKYDLTKKIPESIMNHLNDGFIGKIVETPKKGFKNSQNFILGNISIALNATKLIASQLGYSTIIFDEYFKGEARVLGEKLVDLLFRMGDDKDYCYILGGETTVTINGTGKGGRNQEVILGALRKLLSVNKNLLKNNFVIGSIGTDGRDGPTDAAGAYIDHTSTKYDLFEVEKYLENNDSYNYFSNKNNLIKTGATGTNVNDVVIILKKCN